MAYKKPQQIGKSPKGADAFRTPNELFGRGAEMDVSLEKKLLNNLKKYLIMQFYSPIDTSSISKLDNPQFSSFPHATVLSARSRDSLVNSSINSLSNAPLNSNSTNTDGNLLTSLTQRLTKVEELTKVQQRELIAKENALQLQTQKLEYYEQQIVQLKNEREQNKQRIHEMETFLSDYGLVWVGPSEGQAAAIPTSKSSHHSNNSDEKNDPDGEDHYHMPHILPPILSEDQSLKKNKTNVFKLDIEKVRHSIAELNILAGESTYSHAGVHSKGGKIRQLKEQQAVPVTFYKNGFKLFAGPFRPYSNPDSQLFIKDLYDGYFPYELKDRFPNGVSFKLSDMSDKSYEFSVDSSAKTSDNSIPMSCANGHEWMMMVKDIRGMSSLDNNNQTTAQFLQKLPVATIKNGRVLDIRQTISNLTQGAVNSSTYSPLNGLVLADLQSETFETEANAKDTAKLKLKTETGDTLLVKLKYNDTIGSLRELIDKHRNNNSMYEIRTTFPKQVHSDLSATMEGAGLIPTATLFIKRVNISL